MEIQELLIEKNSINIFINYLRNEYFVIVLILLKKLRSFLRIKYFCISEHKINKLI